MPICALAGDLVTCAGMSLYGASITVIGGLSIVGLAVTVGMDTMRAGSRGCHEFKRSAGLAKVAIQQDSHRV